MNSNQPIHPPRWPLAVLRKVIRPDYLEEIEGDMYEEFLDNLEQMPGTKARRSYAWECLKLFRANLLSSPQFLQKLNTYTMFKTNLKIAFRLFKKSKTYTAINILGLASALTITLLLLQFVRFELSYESYNPDAEDVARLTMDYLDGDVVFEQDCETYPPLGPKVKEEFPQVKEYARAYHIDKLTLKVGDQYFIESMMYGADPSFFKMFNHPFVKGNQETAFLAPNETVLTRKQALKMFGTEDAIGKSVAIYGTDYTLKVVGIIENPPANTHLKFNMLLSYETLKAYYGEKDDNWGGNNTFTYVQLTDKSQYPSFLSRLDQLNKDLVEQEFLGSERVLAQPMADIHLYSHKSFEAEPNGSASTVYFMLGVAILIMLIAVFNYINLSTSKALDRAKEVGIRKMNGATRSQLISQFYMESILMFVFGGVLSLVLIISFADSFKNLAQVPLEWNFIENMEFWLLFSGILMVSILLSGSIPSLILSSFKPADVLKGKFTHSISGNRLRQALVVLQFGITVFLLVQTLTASLQLKYMQDKDLGLNGENVIVLNAPEYNLSKERYDAFRGDLLNRPAFINVAMSEATPGMAAHQMSTSTGIHLVDALEKHNNNMYIYFVDHEFFEVMDMSIISGENFIDGENKQKLIVNEEALRIWGVPDSKSAVGKKVAFWGEHSTIIGVIKDFHQFSPKDPLIPMIFLANGKSASLFNIQTTGINPLDQVSELEKVYESHFPNDPFDFFFLDQEFDKQYQQDVQFQQVFSLLSGLAILIACLGLFGLASFTITKRSKEIGIRKVLGASIQQIILLVSSQFMKLVGVAMLIALPVTYLIVDKWLDNFTYRIDLSAWLILLPAVIIMLVAFVSIFGKTYYVSITNPVESLRDE